MGLEYTETVFPVKTHYTILDVHPLGVVRLNDGMEFGANLKRYRKARKLTQAQLAELVGKEQPTIRRWEASEREPSHDDLQNLARALGVHVADLFREVEGDALPSEHELQKMIQAAMDELPVGVSYADFPHAVASGLHAHLRQFSAHGGYRVSSDEAIAPDKDAPPRAPTRQPVREARRSR